MSIEEYKITAIVSAVLGLVLLILSILYAWKIVYGIANKHVVFRTRRPILLIISVFLCCINIIVRSINTYLIMNFSISIAVYRDIVTFFGFTTSLSMMFSRIWLLWYDLKKVRIEQKYIITNCLQQTDDSMPLSAMSALFSKKSESEIAKPGTMIELPKRKLSFIFRNSHIFGSSLKSSLIWLICALIIFIFSAIAHRVTHTFKLSNAILILYVVCVMSAFTYLVLWVWYCETNCCLCKCCGCINEEEISLANLAEDDDDLSSILSLNLYRSAFRDEWNIRYEITALYICVFVGVILVFLIQRFGFELDGEIYSDQWFFGTFLYLIQVSIINWGSIIAQIFIPWYTYRKFKKLENDDSIHQRNSEFDIGLKGVLSHQKGFYAFLQQLVNEFSAENLIYLIECWQFKYHDINQQRSRKKSRMRANSGTNEEDTEISFWSANTLTNMTSLSIPYLNGSLSKEMGAHFYNNILRKLPWQGLPIGHSMSSSNNNKMEFARILFNKYIADHSCECINISGNARGAIVKEWKELELWMNMQSNNCSSVLDSNLVEIDLDEEVNGIKSAEDFEHRLYNLFDASYADVFHNLDYCLSRFRLTPEFRMLKKRRQSKVEHLPTICSN